MRHKPSLSIVMAFLSLGSARQSHNADDAERGAGLHRRMNDYLVRLESTRADTRPFQFTHPPDRLEFS